VPPPPQVRVTEIIANTYYARVHVSRAGDPPHEVDVDARPSDAINLAVRFGAPVYISKKIAGGGGRGALGDVCWCVCIGGRGGGHKCVYSLSCCDGKGRAGDGPAGSAGVFC